MKKFWLLSLMIIIFTTGCQFQQHMSSELIDKEYIKKSIKIGMTQEEIINVFGEKFAVVSCSMDEDEVWRFDFPLKEGYKFDEEYDFADIEGILDRDIYAQLFISWDEDSRVYSYSYLFLNEEDGRVYQFSQYGKDLIKEIPIT